MIKFTKKLAIVASLVTLSSGQFVAFGSNDNSNNDVDGAESYLKRLAITPAPALKTLGPIVKPNKIQILTHAVGGTPVGNLRLVCREWGYIVDELIQKDGEQKTPYIKLPLISQHFVKAAFGGLGNDAFYEVFAKLRLIYRPTPESEGVVLPFLDLKNPFCGTFNLAECGDTGQDLRFTTSLKDFFEIGGENKDRVVILFAPRSLVTQRKESTAKPLSPVMELWTSDLGIFWRWGSSQDLCWFYHMVTRPLVGSDGIASENLLKHWEKSKKKDVVDDGPPGVESLAYFTLDCEPKLEL